MRRLVDLHTHSTASDGRLAPAEVVGLADRRRLAAVALTDHDTLDGLPAARAAAEAFGELTFIPGIELSTAFTGGEAHMLGLHVDGENPSLKRLAGRLRHSREQRNPQIIRRLRDLGVQIDLDDVLALAADVPADRRVVGRPHIAAAIVAKGYASDTKQAFDRYLARGAAAYVERVRPTPAEAIAAIHDAGGVAVLAHPVHLGFDNFAQCERIVRSFQAAGLDGLEAYHNDQGDLLTRFLLALARRRGLIVTGGSDFHGRPNEPNHMGRPHVPAAVLGPLRDRADAVGRR